MRYPLQQAANALSFRCQGMCFKFTPADNQFHHVNENFLQTASVFILAAY